VPLLVFMKHLWAISRGTSLPLMSSLSHTLNGVRHCVLRSSVVAGHDGSTATLLVDIPAAAFFQVWRSGSVLNLP
jgi:hypothetical protein